MNHAEIDMVISVLRLVDERHHKSGLTKLSASLLNHIHEWVLTHGSKELLAEIAIKSLRNHPQFISPEQCFEYLYSAAEDGYAPAQYEIAWGAKSRKLPPPNYYQNETECNTFWKSEYEKWVRLAADNADLDAQYLLAKDLIGSDNAETRREGLNWLRRSACNIESDPEAKFDYAKHMEQGDYSDQPDQRTIFEFYKDAAFDLPPAGVPTWSSEIR